MSRKHYRQVAALIAGEASTHRDNPVVLETLRRVMLSMADLFAQEPGTLFDRERFYAACYLSRYSPATYDDSGEYPLGHLEGEA